MSKQETRQELIDEMIAESKIPRSYHQEAGRYKAI